MKFLMITFVLVAALQGVAGACPLGQVKALDESCVKCGGDFCQEKPIRCAVCLDKDNESPAISGCPIDQSVNTDSGSATAVVTWTAPTATDNSGSQTLTSTYNPGDFFSIGNNIVTYTSKDAAGNTDTCTFYVDVTDNESPAISGCPSDQSVNTDSGSATAVVTWAAPTATDNSGSQTMTSTYNPGDYFSTGNNTVTYTSKDAAGNVDTCTFYVDVTGTAGSKASTSSGESLMTLLFTCLICVLIDATMNLHNV